MKSAKDALIFPVAKPLLSRPASSSCQSDHNGAKAANLIRADSKADEVATSVAARSASSSRSREILLSFREKTSSMKANSADAGSAASQKPQCRRALAMARSDDTSPAYTGANRRL